MGGLAFTFIAALRFSFFSFIKTFAEKYNLLLILGIKAKDFWKLALKEYFLEVFLLGVKVILIGNIICIGISYALFYHSAIDAYMLARQFVLTAMFVFLLYVLILSLTMAAILFNRQKKSLIDFFDRFTQDSSKMPKIKNGDKWMFFAGTSFWVISFATLINFRVEKLIAATFFNIFGFYLLIHSSGFLVKKIIGKFNNAYYKKILIWADLVFQYKVNSYLIFVIYTLNFILACFMSGLIASDDSMQADIKSKYPYEAIAYSDGHIDVPNNYCTLLVSVPGYGSATAISNHDYNNLMNSEYTLKKGEVLWVEESGSPLVEEEIEVMNEEGMGQERLKYHVKNAKREVVFGQDAIQELNEIIVFNDRDFASLLGCKAGAERNVFLSEQDVDRNSLQLGSGAIYWSRTQQIEKERIENKVVIALLYMISFVLILEGQAFIFTKQIANYREECYRYDVLMQLGIKKEDLEEIIERKIKGILMIPAVLATVSGIIFLVMDICQEPEGVTPVFLLQYGAALLAFAFIQFLGCHFISRNVKKIYMN